MPTGAEWEYAARAGSTGSFCFDESKEKLEDYAWTSENSEDKTHPVGELKANAWGLKDMHGNVWERCSDWYADYEIATDPNNPVEDPQGPTSCTYHSVLRGGSYHNRVDCAHSAMRMDYSKYDNMGAFGAPLLAGFGARLVRTKK